MKTYEQRPIDKIHQTREDWNAEQLANLRAQNKEMAEVLRRYVSHLKLNGLSDPDASAILTKLEVAP